MAWFQKYGSASHPMRQSDISKMMTSQWSCALSWSFDQEIPRSREGEARINRELGTAVHATLERYEAEAIDRILAGELPSEEALRLTLGRELERAFDGRAATYSKSIRDLEAALEQGSEMALGWLAYVAKHQLIPVAIEESFALRLERPGKEPLFLVGTVDRLYTESMTGRLIMPDLKSGMMKPAPEELVRGSFQLSIYAEAVRSGHWYAEDTGEAVRASLAAHGDIPPGGRTFGRFPDSVGIAHLRNGTRYKKKSKRKASAEDAAFFGVEKGSELTFEKGDQRGPIFLPAGVTPERVDWLFDSIRRIAGAVRFGLMRVPSLGPACDLCAHRQICREIGGSADASPRAERSLIDSLEVSGLEGL